MISVGNKEFPNKNGEKNSVAAAFGVWRGKIKDSKEYVDKLRESWKARK